MHAGAPATVATADLDRLGIPLPEAELQARFEALQRARPSMRTEDARRGLTRDGRRPLAQRRRPAARLDEASGVRGALPLPSLPASAAAGTGDLHTSEAVQPNLIDYYVGLLPGVVASHARARLYLVSPHDGGPAPLSAKLLGASPTPRRDPLAGGDPDCAHVVPFSTTRLERDLALRLGIPMYGADPKFTLVGNEERRTCAVRRGRCPIQRAERACAPATTSSTRCSSWWRRGRASSPGPERRGGIRVWQRRARCARAERGGSSQGRAAAKRASP